MLSSTQKSSVIRAILLALSCVVSGGRGIAQIESLDPPPAAKPPRLDENQENQDNLEKKRRERHRREDEARPPSVPYAEQRQAGLLKDTLTPHERSMMLEVSLLGCGLYTRVPREGYTCNVTSHFNAFFRYQGRTRDGRVGLFYGGRLAPFSGTGFYNSQPGVYGLTYFGPMIGVGKIDPVPEDEGGARASRSDGELQIPSASGWVVTTGLAAVNRLGHSAEPGPLDEKNDFQSKNVYYDRPGLWVEARYLRILYGALGFDGVFGAQAGRGKVFVYGGIGVAAYN